MATQRVLRCRGTGDSLRSVADYLPRHNRGELPDSQIESLYCDYARATAHQNELLYKVCDVVISPTGEKRYVTSAKKLYDVIIAPRRKAEGLPDIDWDQVDPSSRSPVE